MHTGETKERHNSGTERIAPIHGTDMLRPHPTDEARKIVTHRTQRSGWYSNPVPRVLKSAPLQNNIRLFIQSCIDNYSYHNMLFIHHSTPIRKMFNGKPVRTRDLSSGSPFSSQFNDHITPLPERYKYKFGNMFHNRCKINIHVHVLAFIYVFALII